MSIKTTWNLKELYNSDLAWNKDLIKAEKLFLRIQRADKDIQETAQILKLLSLEDTLKKKIRLLHTYSFLKSELNIKSSNARENLQRVIKLESIVDIELAMIHSLINKLPTSKLRYIQGLKKSKPIKALLNSIIKEKRYKVLSNKEKKIVELYSQQFDAYGEIHLAIQVSNINFNRISAKGKTVKLNHANVMNYCCNPNRELRKKAHAQRQKTYDKNKDSIAAALKGHISGQVLQSKVEKANNPIDNILSVEGFDKDFFDQMLNANIKQKPFIKKYYNSFRKEVRIRTLYSYDLHAEQKKKSNKKFTIQEAKDLILDATKNLSKEFANTIDKAFSENWIQIVNSHSKNYFLDGFSFNPTITHPFVLTTFDGSATDVLTLAHEIGHSSHGFIGSKKNSYYEECNLASSQELFAFTTELLTSYKILENCTTPIMKKEFLNTLLRYFINNTYDRGQKVDMEMQLYEMLNNNQKFTSSILNQKNRNINKKYYKSIINLRGDIGVDWAFSDYYFSNFYAAEYLVAFCLATYCADRILSDDKEFINRYEKAMALGGSAYISKICKILEPDTNIYDPKFLIDYTYKKMQEITDMNN